MAVAGPGACNFSTLILIPARIASGRCRGFRGGGRRCFVGALAAKNFIGLAQLLSWTSVVLRQRVLLRSPRTTSGCRFNFKKPSVAGRLGIESLRSVLALIG